MKNNYILENVEEKVENENYLKEIASEINNKVHYVLNREERYDLKTIVLLFFFFAIISWIWEVVLFFVQTGEIVNKGTLIGPWLPIYGFGTVIVLSICSKQKIKKNFFLTFIIISVVCSILEFYTSVYLEDVYELRWWDYSNYFLNIEGRICLLASIFFGLVGCFGLYIVVPIINKEIKSIPSKIQKAICAILIIFFLIDFGYCINHPNSGDGITFKLIDNKYFISIKDNKI